MNQMLCPAQAPLNSGSKLQMDFNVDGNFPHCLGAIDGKHVAITCPQKGGSLFYNYKGWHSVILMDAVGADYKFIWYDVGTNGAASDSQIFKDLYDAIQDGSLNMPPPDCLPNYDTPKPYYFNPDDAFALKTRLMKPHANQNLTWDQRVFNYRLSRARRVVENAFGILAQRCGCLLGTMHQAPETVAIIIRAAVSLHYLLRIKNCISPRVINREDNLQSGFLRRIANMHDMEQHMRGSADIQ